MVLSGFIALIPRNLLRNTRLLSRANCSSKIKIRERPFSTVRGLYGRTAADVDEAQVMQNILYRVRHVNYMPDDIRQSLLGFRVDGIPLGKVRPAIADMLCTTGSNVFELKKSDKQQEYLTLAEETGSTSDSRTKAVAQVMEKLRDQGIVTGWRDESYPIGPNFYEPPVFVMERAAVPLLGAIEYGVHINGLVQKDGETKMWMARRSADKSKFPRMLDHIVAGGQPAGMSLMDNVVKECLEEANIPEDLTKAGVQAAGAISYETYSPSKDRVSRAVLFNYDLYLPANFQPTPVDGEVQEFFLWNIDQILESMAPDYHDPIKPNCYLVIIDWLLRQGHISPEVPGYLDVLRELRSGDCR